MITLGKAFVKSKRAVQIQKFEVTDCGIVAIYYTNDRWSYSKGHNSLDIKESIGYLKCKYELHNYLLCGLPWLVISTWVTQMGSVRCTFHQGWRSPLSVEEAVDAVLPSTAFPATKGVPLNTYVLLWVAGRFKAKFVSAMRHDKITENHLESWTIFGFHPHILTGLIYVLGLLDLGIELSQSDLIEWCSKVTENKLRHLCAILFLTPDVTRRTESIVLTIKLDIFWTIDSD